jgi:1-hydroxycarotenoid 3,4-desaturase
LTKGLLGQAAAVIPARATTPRSLSAHVWAFAATPAGPPLIHHNVFFTDTPAGEFGPIGRGQMPETPSLYVCAQDRAVTGSEGGTPTGPERFEIIVNAPAGLRPTPDEDFLCRNKTFQTLARYGLTFTDGVKTLTTPTMLDHLFPASMGAIYGRSPEGTFAAFQRPLATTALPGLYLAGGGTHPGAGVPMAALSGRHAAAAIMTARISASKSHPMVTPGGMLTGSATTAQKPSVSSAS